MNIGIQSHSQASSSFICSMEECLVSHSQSRTQYGNEAILLSWSHYCFLGEGECVGTPLRHPVQSRHYNITASMSCAL